MHGTQDPRYGTVDEYHGMIGAVMNDDGGWEHPKRFRARRVTPESVGPYLARVSRSSGILEDESRFPRLPDDIQLFGAHVVILEEIRSTTPGFRRLASLKHGRSYIPGITGTVLSKTATQWSSQEIGADSPLSIVQFGYDILVVPKSCLRRDEESAVRLHRV